MLLHRFIYSLLLCLALPANVFAFGAVLVTPTGVSSSSASAGSDLDADTLPASQLIDGSGLTETPDISNFISVTHASASASNAWLTGYRNPYSSDFFSAPDLSQPLQVTFTFSQVYQLTDMILWGYFTGTPSSPLSQSDEAKTFEIEFSTDGGATFSEPAHIRSVQLLSESAARISFEASFANVVRLTIIDNHHGTTTSGGDRVGLGEVRFVAHPIPVTDSGNFGSVGLNGSYVEQTYVFFNPNAVPIPMGTSPRATLSGSGASHFTIERDLDEVIEPFGYTYATVRFKPTVASTHDATLNITAFPGLNQSLNGLGVIRTSFVATVPNSVTPFSGTLEGDLLIDGDGPSGSSSGTVVSLTGDTVIEGDLTLRQGVLQLNGHTITVKGTFVHDGYDSTFGEVGRVECASGSEMIVEQNYLHLGGPFVADAAGNSSLRVIGDYETTPTGSGHEIFSSENLTGSDSGQLVFTVEGNFTADIQDHIDWTAIASLELGGDLTQISTTGYSTFRPAKLIFSGNYRQLITLEDPELSFSELNAVILFTEMNQLNPMVEFAQPLPIIDELSPEGSQFLQTQPGVTINFHALLAPPLSTLCIQGDAEDRIFTTQLPSGITPLGGHFIFKGDLVQNHTVLNTLSEQGAPTRIVVHGDCERRLGGTKMQSIPGHPAHFIAKGNLTLNSDIANYSWDVLEIQGNLNMTGPEGFFAKTAVIFSGTGSQTVSIENADDSIFPKILNLNPDLRFASIIPIGGFEQNSIRILDTIEGADVTNESPFLIEDMHWRVNGNLRIDGDPETSGIYLRDSSQLTVFGNYYQETGKISLFGEGEDSVKFRVTGDFEQSRSVSTITGEVDDHILIEGDAIIASEHLSNSNVIWEFRGDVDQINQTEPKSRGPLANADVLLTGTELQTLSFEDPAANSFNSLGVTNPEVYFAQVPNFGTFFTDSGVEINTVPGIPILIDYPFFALPPGIVLNVNSDLTVNDSNGFMFLQNSNLNVNGNLYLDSGDNYDLADASLNVSGDMIMKSGSMNISSASGGGSYVLVQGDFRQQLDTNMDGTYDAYSSAWLGINSETSVLEVMGDAVFNDFFQLDSDQGTALILSGSDTQQRLQFRDASSTYIDTLILTNPLGMTFYGPIEVERLFNHNGNPFDLDPSHVYQDFNDYDLDRVPDHLDPRPLVNDGADFETYTSLQDWGTVHALIEADGNSSLEASLIADYTNPTSDSDADGNEVILEYLLGTNPRTKDVLPIRGVVGNVSGVDYGGIEIEFVKAARNSVSVDLLSSDSLSGFVSEGFREKAISETATHKTIQVLDPSPASASNKRFYQLLVE